MKKNTNVNVFWSTNTLLLYNSAVLCSVFVKCEICYTTVIKHFQISFQSLHVWLDWVTHFSKNILNIAHTLNNLFN